MIEHDATTCKLCQSDRQTAYEYKWKNEIIDVIRDLVSVVQRLETRIDKLEKGYND